MEQVGEKGPKTMIDREKNNYSQDGTPEHDQELTSPGIYPENRHGGEK
jgi:hypothetical protein